MPRRKRLTRSEVVEIYKSTDPKMTILKEYNIGRDTLNKIKAGVTYCRITGGKHVNYRDMSYIREKNIESYRGYIIKKVNANNSNGFSEYYTIFKGERKMTQMYLASPKACKNVIDTLLRNNPPAYIPSTEHFQNKKEPV